LFEKTAADPLRKKEKIMKKKNMFLPKNSRVNPLRNCLFFEGKKRVFFWRKNRFFIKTTVNPLINVLFLEEKKKVFLGNFFFF
jgi:hypothetical protein